VAIQAWGWLDVSMGQAGWRNAVTNSKLDTIKAYPFAEPFDKLRRALPKPV